MCHSSNLARPKPVVSLPGSTICDCLTSMLHFVKYLDDSWNSLQLTLKTRKTAGCSNEVIPGSRHNTGANSTGDRFATDYLRAIKLCLMISYAAELRCASNCLWPFIRLSKNAFLICGVRSTVTCLYQSLTDFVHRQSVNCSLRI